MHMTFLQECYYDVQIKTKKFKQAKFISSLYFFFDTIINFVLVQTFKLPVT